MNREYSHKIIKKLLEWGVAEFYVCAGARNFPLVETVLNIKSKKKSVFNHFEERCAAFYAVGRIKTLKKPVAVITTSGTAVGELLPAVMESYYSGLPLVLLTADRPRTYRGTNAPQTAEQKNIFGNYVSECLDIENDEAFEISHIARNKPLHINICFDVPLQSGVITPLVIPDVFARFDRGNQTVARSDGTAKLLDKKKSVFPAQVEKFNEFLKKAQNTIVILSQIREENKSNLIRFLKKLNFPIYIESISNLRECEALSHLRIHCPDKIWYNSKKSNYNIHSVIKIGNTPTHRFWRDLDEFHKHIKVFSIVEQNFPGMPNAVHIATKLNDFFKLSIKLKLKKNDKICLNNFLLSDLESFKVLEKLLYKYQDSEQSFFFNLSNTINKNANVYLGNSMPIRYWDFCATFIPKKFVIDASRGLNGIDGQISTFLGYAHESFEENWGIFGDLTTLYDLAGPWMLRHRPHLNVNIVIVNNSGGKIFSRVLQGKDGEFCQNTHNLQFQHFAKLWNLKYKKITSHKQINKLKTNGQNVFEIIPNMKQTNDFTTEWNKNLAAQLDRAVKPRDNCPQAL